VTILIGCVAIAAAAYMCLSSGVDAIVARMTADLHRGDNQ
jgi:hypothetical protein